MRDDDEFAFKYDDGDFSEVKRDPALLYLLCEAGRPGSESPLRLVVKPSFRSILHIIFTYVVGDRQVYCEWEEHETLYGLSYASYTPSSPTNGGVVLLYLHGSGSRGSNYSKMRLQSLPRIVQETENFPYPVICPLCPLKTEWSKPKMLDKLGRLIDGFQSSASVVVTGPSMGGLGTWMTAAKFSEKIAAAIPICGGGKPVFAPLVARKVPCWFFHAANDTCVSVLETDKLVDTMRSLIPAELHDHWVRYSRYDTCLAPWNIPWCEGHDAFTPCYKTEWEQVRVWIDAIALGRHEQPSDDEFFRSLDIDQDTIAEWREAWELFSHPTNEPFLEKADVNRLAKALGMPGDILTPGPGHFDLLFVLPGCDAIGKDREIFMDAGGRISFKGFVYLLHHKMQPYDGPCCEICCARLSKIPHYDAFECRPKEDKSYCVCFGNEMGCRDSQDFINLQTAFDAFLKISVWPDQSDQSEINAFRKTFFTVIRERLDMVYPGPKPLPSASMIAAILCMGRSLLPPLPVGLQRRIYEFLQKPRGEFEMYRATSVCGIICNLMYDDGL